MDMGRNRNTVDGHNGEGRDRDIYLPHGSLRCALLRSTNIPITPFAGVAGATGVVDQYQNEK